MISASYLINIARLMFLGSSLIWLWITVSSEITPEAYVTTVWIFGGMLMADYLSRTQLLIYSDKNFIVPAISKTLLVANLLVLFVLVSPIMTGGYIPLMNDSNGLHFFVDKSIAPFGLDEMKFYVQPGIGIVVILVALTEYFFMVCPTLDRESVEKYIEQMEAQKNE
ncbi:MULTISPECIES: hypothetical protein [unclassified Exiguobacterium]|uniref:hypothetical protein n=1 Tax=unclassified Exiguobacterium TaxID=2644629 RepID=UPI001BED2668|nr:MULTISPECIES: hypothetical protein [unclassified Exiguobacterium]